MDLLTKTWVDNQAFAKSQGWILDYYILNNINPRDGEPDIILLSRFADYPSVKEIDRRNGHFEQADEPGRPSRRGRQRRARRDAQAAGSVLYRELQKR